MKKSNGKQIQKGKKINKKFNKHKDLADYEQ